MFPCLFSVVAFCCLCPGIHLPSILLRSACYNRQHERLLLLCPSLVRSFRFCELRNDILYLTIRYLQRATGVSPQRLCPSLKMSPNSERLYNQSFSRFSVFRCCFFSLLFARSSLISFSISRRSAFSFIFISLISPRISITFRTASHKAFCPNRAFRDFSIKTSISLITQYSQAPTIYRVLLLNKSIPCQFIINGTLPKASAAFKKSFAIVFIPA